LKQWSNSVLFYRCKDVNYCFQEASIDGYECKERIARLKADELQEAVQKFDDQD
jgi:hypothetical protein